MSRTPMQYLVPKDPDFFELLCMKLLRKRWKCPQLEQYGKRGEQQFGIDLLDLAGADPLRAAQCKLREVHKTISPTEIQEEVDKAKLFEPKLGVYAILTTAKVSTHSDRKIIEINRKHGMEGLFSVELLNWDRIQQLLDEYSDVREEMYGGADAAQVAKIDEKLTDIHASVKAAGAEQSAERYHAEIDEAKAAVERRDFQLAKLVLQRLRRQHWDELTPRLKFRLLSNLGAAWLGEADAQKAATCFLEAKTHQPDDEKALANEVLAHFIMGEVKTAFDLSSKLIEKFPHATQVVSLWITSSPEVTTLSSLEAQIAPELIKDADVAVALALRALRELDFGRAEVLLRGVRTGRTDGSRVPGLLAGVILGSELHKIFGRSDVPSDGRQQRLKEAEGFSTRAVELAKKEGINLLVTEHLLERAQIRMLLSDKEGVASDVEEAYGLSPTAPNVLAMMGEVSRSKGDLDRGIEILRRALQISQEVDAQYQLASMLRGRGKSGDCIEAAELLRGLLRDEKVPKPLRVPIVALAIDCLVKIEKPSEGESLVDRLPTGYVTNLATLAFRAYLAFKEGNHENANKSVDAALALVSESNENAELEFLAKLLNDLGRHKDALPLWQSVIRPGGSTSDPRRLLDTALRLRRHDVILETCEDFRKAGVENRDLLDYEVNVLEQYDVDAAISVLSDYLSKHPEDDLARLSMSIIGLRTDKKELICADPLRVPNVSAVVPNIAAAVVQVLKLGGRPDDALVYAYEFLRLHFSDATAHRAYQFVLLPFGPMPNIVDYQFVDAGAAVTYVEDGEGIPHTVVIEESPKDGPRFQNELPPAHIVARELMGKREGDSFVLARGSVSVRTGRITKVLNKYVYRYQDSMSQWQIRFPEQSTMESIQVVKEPGGDVDLTVILASVDRQQEAAKAVEELYRTAPIPVHMIASRFGMNAFLGIGIIAEHRGLPLNCCAGSLEERTRALNDLKVCSEIVLDLTAISTIYLLDLEELLRNIGIPLLISQSTLSELHDLINDEELTTSQAGYFTKVGDRYALIEESSEQKVERIKRLKGLVCSLESAARIIPCRELTRLEPEKRDVLYKAFGQHGAESILLAASPGRLLWTDDYTLARFAAGESGVRRVWTQIVLQQCADAGRITPETYRDASAKLLGFEYSFTSSNPQILMSAARLANWNPNQRPLNQALEQFKTSSVDLRQLLQLVSLFAVLIYQEPIDLDLRDQTLTRVLDNLSTNAGGADGIRAIEAGLQRLFGLNAVGAQQASNCILRWLNRPNLTG